MLAGTVVEVAGLAAAVAAEVARQHAAGRTHGGIGLEAVRVEAGRVELSPGPGDGTPADDVAAIGRLLAAALEDVGARRRQRGAEALGRIAAQARRAAVTEGGPSAADLVTLIVRAVPDARLPRAPVAPQRHRSGTSRRRSGGAVVRAAFTITALVVLEVALLRLGDGTLAAPPVFRLGSWVAATDPAIATMAVIRLVALGCTSYVLATTTLGFATAALRLRRASHVVEAASVPAVRRLVAAAVGVSVTGHALLTAPSVPTSRVSVAESATPALEKPEPAPAAPAPPLPAPPAPTSAPMPEREWTVRPGDHLWSIAQTVLAEASGRLPSNAETDPYWRRLVAANTDRLADPANPDLVLAGQSLRVPVVSAT